MAESISIFFKTARPYEVSSLLDAVAVRVDEASPSSGYGSETWLYPRDREASVVAYPYEDLLVEYEDDDVERLVEYLGAFHQQLWSSSIVVRKEIVLLRRQRDWLPL